MVIDTHNLYIYVFINVFGGWWYWMMSFASNQMSLQRYKYRLVAIHTFMYCYLQILQRVECSSRSESYSDYNSANDCRECVGVFSRSDYVRVLARLRSTAERRYQKRSTSHLFYGRNAAKHSGHARTISRMSI